jgi:hypothetical protein
MWLDYKNQPPAMQAERMHAPAYTSKIIVEMRMRACALTRGNDIPETFSLPGQSYASHTSTWSIFPRP